MNFTFNSFSFKTASAISLTTFLLTLVAACSKNGEQVTSPAVINVTVTSFSTNETAIFNVSVNDIEVVDSLFNRQKKTRIIGRADGLQHVVVKDRVADTLLVDTLLSLPNNSASITVLQFDITRPPVVIGQADSEVEAGKRAISFFFTDPLLPDSFGVELYGCYYDLNTGVLLKVDTLGRYNKIKKGVLSEIKVVKDTTMDAFPTYFFQPLDPNTGAPMENSSRPFDPEFASGPTISFSAGPNGDEKNFVYSLLARAQGDKIRYLSTRLVAY